MVMETWKEYLDIIVIVPAIATTDSPLAIIALIVAFAAAIYVLIG